MEDSAESQLLALGLHKTFKQKIERYKRIGTMPYLFILFIYFARKNPSQKIFKYESIMPKKASYLSFLEWFGYLGIDIEDIDY